MILRVDRDKKGGGFLGTLDQPKGGAESRGSPLARAFPGAAGGL